MRKFSEKISWWFYQREYIQNTQIDDLTFGLEVILSNLLSFITITIVGFMIGDPLKTILFLIVFIIFRTIRDRYHAETFLACYILTLCSFFIPLLLSKYIVFNQTFLVLNLVILNGLLLFIFSETLNEPKKRQQFINFVTASVVYNLIPLFLLVVNQFDYAIFLSSLGTVVVFTAIKGPKGS